MRKDFVGLIGHHGNLELRVLLPECREARRWLQNFTEQYRGVGIWAVMDCSVAAEIELHLAEGSGAAALRRMASGADCMGPLLTEKSRTEQWSTS